MNRIEHPCKGMTPAQRRDFELIACGQRPIGHMKTTDKLEARGLIERISDKVIGRDAFGVVSIPEWIVPLHIHAQWCEWCAEGDGDKSHENPL